MDMHHLIKGVSFHIPQCQRLLAPIALSFVCALAAGPIARAVTEAAVPVRMAAPEYPYELKRDGISGVVTVVFCVDEKGNVVDPVVQKSSNKGFEEAALAAISRWKFKPALQDGTPVRSKVAIPLQFSRGEE
jgi:protein TonB